jgi:endonuclease I
MRLKLFFTLLISYINYAQIPEYYSSIDFSQSSEALKTQLASLITSTHTTELVYTSGSSGLLDTWSVLKQSDLSFTIPEHVLLLYGWDDSSITVSEHYSRHVDESCHTSSCTGKWVREHTFPRSLGTPNLGSQGAGSDAHNLRAIDSQRNNSRGNKLFGDAPASIPSHSIDTNTWYPGDEWVGDVARIILYMYLRYPTQCAPTSVTTGNSNFSPLGDIPNILLIWNAQDPPSDFEIHRNNVIASHQGNRNPFIDNPILATLIWNGPEAFDSWDLLSTIVTTPVEFKLYPTITTGLVYIENSSALQDQYIIYNAQGQLLHQDMLQNQIDLSGYANGLYFIKVSNSTNTQTFKVFKQ